MRHKFNLSLSLSLLISLLALMELGEELVGLWHSLSGRQRIRRSVKQGSLLSRYNERMDVDVDRDTQTQASGPARVPICLMKHILVNDNESCS